MSDSSVKERLRFRRPIFVSIHHQMLILFTVVFALIFGVTFYWGYQDAMRQTKEHLVDDLGRIAKATAAGVDGDAYQSLAESDFPSGGLVNDQRYTELIEWLALVQQVQGEIQLLDGTQADRVLLSTYVAAGPDRIAYLGDARAVSSDSVGRPLPEMGSWDTSLLLNGLERTIVAIDKLRVNQWGSWATGASPIYDSAGEVVGAVEVNLRDTTVLALQNRVKSVFASTLVVSYLVLLLAVTAANYVVGRPIIALSRSAAQLMEAGEHQIDIVEKDCVVCSEINTLAQIFDTIIQQSRQGETRYRALVNSLPGPAFVCNTSGAMHFITPQIEPLLGYSAEEWTSQQGRFWMGILDQPESGRIHSILADVKSVPLVGEVKTRVRHKNGEYRWIEARFTRFEGRGESLAVGIIVDITDQRKNQKELESYNHELRIANEQLQETQQQLVRSAQLASVGELATVVAHEINNPLTAVRGLAQLLVQDCAPGDQWREPLEQIVFNTDRMSNTVKNLHSFARPSPGDEQLVDLNCLLADALTLISAQLEEQEITLVQQVEPDLPMVCGVSAQLGQVLVNLLTNARDAILETGAPGRISVSIYHDLEDRHVHLAVADTGAGIFEEHQDQVFTPFFTTKPVGQGTGLGLSTSYRIIEQHRGHILFESKPGEETVFRVILPAQRTVES